MREGRAYFIIQLSDHRPLLNELRAGSQDRKLETGTEARVIDGLFSWLALMASSPAFLYHPGLPARSTVTHSGRGPFIAIMLASLMERIRQLSFSLPRGLQTESNSQKLTNIHRYHM